MLHMWLTNAALIRRYPSSCNNRSSSYKLHHQYWLQWDPDAKSVCAKFLTFRPKLQGISSMA